MKKLFLNIAGSVLLLLGCCVPIAARYLYVDGPDWLTGSGEAVVLSSLCTFLLLVIGGFRSYVVASEIKTIPSSSSHKDLVALNALMLVVGVLLGIAAAVGAGKLQ